MNKITLYTLLSLVTVLGFGFFVYKYFNRKESMRYVELSKEHLAEGSLHYAKEYCETSLYYDETNSEAYLIHGQIFLDELGFFEDALEDINKSMEYGEPTALHYFLKGKCYFRLNDLELAVEEFNRAEKMETEIDSVPYYQGLISDRYKEYNDAVDYYTEALKRLGSSKLVLDKKGNAEFNAKKYEEAIRTFETLNEKYEADLESLYLLSRAYGETGDFEKACQAATNAFNKGHRKSENLMMEFCPSE